MGAKERDRAQRCLGGGLTASPQSGTGISKIRRSVGIRVSGSINSMGVEPTRAVAQHDEIKAGGERSWGPIQIKDEE